MKFRKKPCVIEAVEFRTDNEAEVRAFIGAYPRDAGARVGYPCSEILIHTLEGMMTARIGDWIIRGVNGELYPCKPDIFKKTYEDVTNETPKDREREAMRKCPRCWAAL